MATKTRIREIHRTDPQGIEGVTHLLERVIEIDGDAPSGAEIVADEPFDWRPAASVAGVSGNPPIEM